VRFLADMGVAVPIVEELRRQGHDALHLRDEGLQRSPDQQILDKAIAEDRILLTFDLDFGELAALARDRVVSVILFRLSNARMANVALRLSTVLDASGEALRRGAIVVVEDARHRIRYLPIGSG
jgi:predicted nuclease of predicted toxin-antitoxin system